MDAIRYSAEIAGHTVTISLSGEKGKRVLLLDDIELQEGTNGCFVGGSEPLGKGVMPLVRGEMSTEDYIADLRRRVDLRQIAHAFQGKRVERVWDALTDGALIVH
jgi:prolyl-tRNA editing enzyme YbaK/EbsC (Cys-tRNA(Pro) deacylase)